MEDYFFRIQEYELTKADLEAVLNNQQNPYVYISKEDKKQYLKEYQLLCSHLDHLKKEADECLKNVETCKPLPSEKTYFVNFRFMNNKIIINPLYFF